MPLLKVCFKIPRLPRPLCVHIQAFTWGHFNVPPSPDLIDIGGKRPSWVADAEVLATVDKIATVASPGLRSALRRVVAAGIRNIAGQLPTGVTISRSG